VKRKRKDFEAKKKKGENKQYLGFVNFFFEKKEKRKKQRTREKHREHCYNDTE
jgi:hypothetical protein